MIENLFLTKTKEMKKNIKKEINNNIKLGQTEKKHKTKRNKQYGVKPKWLKRINLVIKKTGYKKKSKSRSRQHFVFLQVNHV